MTTDTAQPDNTELEGAKPTKADATTTGRTKGSSAKAKTSEKEKTAKSEKKDLVERSWHVVNAEGKVLGKLAVQVANILRGKNKPEYSPHIDCGDHVIVINAEKIVTTGKKDEQKLYRSHSGFPHGFKEETLRSLKARRPQAVVEKAIWGMIPHNRLGAKQFTKLKVYEGSEHPHEAQNPVLHEITKSN